MRRLSWMMSRGGALLFSGLLACDERGHGTCAPEAFEPAMRREQSTPVHFDATGVSDSWTLDVHGGGGFLLAEVGEERCVQLDETRLEEGTSLVESRDFGPFCQRCRQRNSTGAHFSFFALPSDDGLLPEGLLHTRVALRDCTTLTSWKGATGETGMLSWIPLNEHSPERRAVLPVSVIALRGSWLASVLEASDAPTRLEGIARELSSRLEPAGLRVRIVSTCLLEAPADGQIEWQERVHVPLERILEEARGRCAGASPLQEEPRVPLVAAPCLTVRDEVLSRLSYPLGYTTHIPGGMLSEGRGDAVFVANTRCGPLRPEASALEEASFASVASHELGHYLGLYHTVETDGVEDKLADTGERNLMNPQPWREGMRGLSASQARIVRRHPSLRWPLPGHEDCAAP